MGLTQAELGARLGVAGNTVARRERENLPIPEEAELAVRYVALEEREAGKPR